MNDLERIIEAYAQHRAEETIELYSEPQMTEYLKRIQVVSRKAALTAMDADGVDEEMRKRMVAIYDGSESRWDLSGSSFQLRVKSNWMLSLKETRRPNDEARIQAIIALAERKGIDYALTLEGDHEATREVFTTRESFLNAYENMGAYVQSAIFDVDTNCVKGMASPDAILGYLSIGVRASLQLIMEFDSERKCITKRAMEQIADRIYGPGTSVNPSQ